MKAKMRIQLLDANLVTLKDRLVDQDTEFTLGAPEKHTGPIKLEVVLRDKADVDGIKKYLDQLLGNLPIAERKVYTKKASTEIQLEPVVELLAEVKAKCKTQDEVIKYLRERNFVFMTAQGLEDRQLGVEIKDEHKEKYQFMVRQLKEAKDPKIDKYDPQLVLGINFMAKGKFIQVYLYQKFSDKLQMPWAEKSDINFKKVAALRFPHYMIQEERDKYSLEVRKMKLNPEYKPSKLYLRWEPVVKEFNK